jgi:PhnB protein
MNVQPYLFFDGKCDEALAFYKSAVGAEPKMLMRFKEAPDQSMVSPGSADKVMHAQVQIGDATVLMSDGRCTGNTNFKGFALTIAVKNESEADKTFNADHADGEDLLLAALWPADRQVRRRLDGACSATLSGGDSSRGRSC